MLSYIQNSNITEYSEIMCARVNIYNEILSNNKLQLYR